LFVPGRTGETRLPVVTLEYRFLRIEAEPQADVAVVLVILPVHPVELALKSQVVGVNCAKESDAIDSSAKSVKMIDLLKPSWLILNCCLVQTSLLRKPFLVGLSHGIESKYFID
jgi:hypothetical protein